MTVKHDGCFVCGSTVEEILYSKTVGAVDTKGRGKVTSVAMCQACFQAHDTIDMRTTRGKS